MMTLMTNDVGNDVDGRGRCQASAGCQEIDVAGMGRPNEDIGRIVC